MSLWKRKAVVLVFLVLDTSFMMVGMYGFFFIVSTMFMPTSRSALVRGREVNQLSVVTVRPVSVQSSSNISQVLSLVHFLQAVDRSSPKGKNSIEHVITGGVTSQNQLDPIPVANESYKGKSGLS